MLAYRRCLDQFTWALTTYFQNDCSSFNDLGAFLGKQKNLLVALPLLEVYNRHVGNFSFVISKRKSTADGVDHHSVRDRISHQEAVPAGVINVTQNGFVLVGGGEDLNIGKAEVQMLNQVLELKTKNLHQCLAEMLRAFINSARQLDKSIIEVSGK